MCKIPHMTPDARSVLLPGPWEHRELSANGTRFHVAVAGSGPLVLLLHGFPEFWWTWHHQLPDLAGAGFRAVAVDLRGYGASDKPPRGYDVPTLAADVAGLIRTLGERDAVVVGHDWGGILAWTLGAAYPELLKGLVIVGIGHPLAHRTAMLTQPRGQLAASRYVFGFQLPRLAERSLTANAGAGAAAYLHAWGGPGFPDPLTHAHIAEAIQIPGVAHCALEYYRWAVRSQLRPDGRRFARLVSRPVHAPLLQVHGGQDRCVLPAVAAASRRYVAGSYRWWEEPAAGHFVHEEAPHAFTRELLAFLHGLG